ncbi:hypothetical protein B0H13DRAFT_167597 [Mycena leptocephala]|nr:hypothetical protein B0H13DRAFT_167597 [Mycena leptocephala]
MEMCCFRLRFFRFFEAVVGLAVATRVSAEERVFGSRMSRERTRASSCLWGAIAPQACPAWSASRVRLLAVLAAQASLGHDLRRPRLRRGRCIARLGNCRAFVVRCGGVPRVFGRARVTSARRAVCELLTYEPSAFRDGELLGCHRCSSLPRELCAPLCFCCQLCMQAAARVFGPRPAGEDALRVVRVVAVTAHVSVARGMVCLVAAAPGSAW